MKLVFIVLEGIDGCGKTTQTKILKEYLESRNLEVFSATEPSKGEYGIKIKNILKRKDASSVSKEKWIELFTLDRKNNMLNIDSELKEGKIVLCDRYYYSTLAYQLQEEEWQKYVEQFLKPDIVFILDAPVEKAIERVKERYRMSGGKKSHFEQLKILKQVRKKYLLMPNYLKDKIKIIDASRSIKEISQDIKKEIDDLIK